jgi:NAD(P)-dependent dehydrogenase (short-subunit alcohol dehydrogenase family)
VAGPLDDSVIVVTGADSELGRGLALAIADAGARLALLGDTGALLPVVTELEARDARAVTVATAFESRDDVERAFATAADELGGAVDGVVHAAMPTPAFETIPFEEVDDARWDAVWEATLQAALFVLQAGYAQMRGRGGRFLFVTPTVSMSGAVGLVPYTAAVEGQRLLAKSAARQWGADGITVNCLAPAPELVPIGIDSMAVSLAPPAMGRPGDPETDLGPIAVHLLSDDGGFVTGVTLCADGGVWMAP